MSNFYCIYLKSVSIIWLLPFFNWPLHCNTDRMKVAQNPLPFPTPLDRLWLDIEKVIDSFHLSNHVSATCREKFSPSKLKADNPHYNTQAGEHLFGWGGLSIFYVQWTRFIIYFICTVWLDVGTRILPNVTGMVENQCSLRNSSGRW